MKTFIYSGTARGEVSIGTHLLLVCLSVARVTGTKESLYCHV